jgi:hypothetical protein
MEISRSFETYVKVYCTRIVRRNIPFIVTGAKTLKQVTYYMLIFAPYLIHLNKTVKGKNKAVSVTGRGGL